MSTNIPIKELEIAEQFFAELGLPFAWHVDALSGEVHAWAIVDAELPARRGAERRRDGGRRRRRSP
jgi:hypothetical protein